MGRTVRELQAVMSAAEFAEWQAFERVEPFGDLREDFRTGMLGAALKNSWRGQDTEPYTPEDFFETLKPFEQVPLTEAEAIAEQRRKSAERIDRAMRQIQADMIRSGNFGPPPGTAGSPKPT